MPNTNIKFRLDIPKLKSTFLSVLKKNMIKKEAIISKTLETEGGYVNDPSDSGGETYCGIARNSNPKWEGWKIVDAHKPLKWNQKIQDSILERFDHHNRFIQCLALAHIKQVPLPAFPDEMAMTIQQYRKWDTYKIIKDGIELFEEEEEDSCCNYITKLFLSYLRCSGKDVILSI